MKRENIYCTLDTETVGGAANPTGTYNFGCTIHDKKGNILATCSLLAMEHFDELYEQEQEEKRVAKEEKAKGFVDKKEQSRMEATVEDARKKKDAAKKICRKKFSYKKW